MKLCLNMIVKNEGERIERALQSVAPFINSWVIIDTGSTDDTKDRIVKFFREWGIAGEIRDVPFENFSQARNAALDWARKLAPFYQADYVLLMDADMELKVSDSLAFQNVLDDNPIAVTLFQKAGSVEYTNTRMLVTLGEFAYKGVTHEYLDVTPTKGVPLNVAYFHDHADGANRDKKFKRDIRLLLADLKKDPTNPRSMYYLASSYRDAGKFAEAAKWFKRRVAAGGWDEEVWSAQVGYATALKDLGDSGGFISEMLKAYNMRPTRAEAMYDLARFFREAEQPAAALAMAEAVAHLPKSKDSLFVNEYVYTVGLKDEIAISSFYVPGKMERGRAVNDDLVLMKTPYVHCGRKNAYWYVQPLKELAPSFEWNPIPFNPPDGLTALNPSVCLWREKLWCNVRAVNYRIDENGAYIIKATDGTANRENPIDTRNFLLDFGSSPWNLAPAKECYRPGNLPCEFPLVTGMEDVRLFDIGYDRLAFSATCRQIAADGQCEQVRGRILQSLDRDAYEMVGLTRMLREPRVTEKNWAPIIGTETFMNRPGHVVYDNGADMIQNDVPFPVDHLSGGSQVIPWTGRRSLAVVHTAHALPNCDYKRFYYHRFIEYDEHYSVTRISLPWVFHDKVIEFCAGMCHHPGFTDRLVLSYGFKDEQARIATISCNDVEKLLAEGHVYVW